MLLISGGTIPQLRMPKLSICFFIHLDLNFKIWIKNGIEQLKQAYERQLYNISEYTQIFIDADKSHAESGICMGIDNNGKILLQSNGIIQAWCTSDTEPV